MKKYIDADLLREKITEQMESLPREVGKGAGTITSKGYGMMQAFQIMRSIIDSFQQEQPEVDIEKCKKYDEAVAIAKAWYKASGSSPQERNVARMIMGDIVMT